jgi:hypothetical protein
MIHEPSSKTSNGSAGEPYRPDRLEYLTGKALAGMSGSVHIGPTFVAEMAVKIAQATINEIEKAKAGNK